MGNWRNYDSLIPSEHDLGQEWRKMPVLPPATPRQITPFLYASDRAPEKPKIETPDGMVTEMRDDLKDGIPVPVKALLVGQRKCDCTGKKHRMYCRVQARIREAVTSLVKEMEQRTHMRLVVMPFTPGDSPITLDDKDGLGPMEVRFVIAPYDSPKAEEL